MSCLMNRLLVWGLLLSSLAIASGRAFAQAATTASKTEDISVFGGVEFANPKYGPNDNSGGVVGLDFTRYFHIPIQPSLELRANFNSGTYADEHSYLFGLRGAYQWRRVMPYVDFLIGPGYIHYPLNIGYTNDNSIVYNYGAGLDLDLVRNFSLKLDVQQQRWNTDTFAFQPVIGVIGLTYRIPFHSQVGYGTR